MIWEFFFPELVTLPTLFSSYYVLTREVTEQEGNVIVGGNYTEDGVELY